MFNNKLTKIIILIIGIIVLTRFYKNKNNRINKLIDIKNINKIDFNKNIEENVNKSFINASIIIPVYNCEKTINYSILYIQNQNLTNLEIILMKFLFT